MAPKDVAERPVGRQRTASSTIGGVTGKTLALVFGLGALITGGLAVLVSLVLLATLIGPFVFWIAWNVLDFGESVGTGELGFWAIVLATFFLVVGGFGKVLVAGIVMLVNPGWFADEALLRWPEPSVKNFVAVALLAGLASFPHNASKQNEKKSAGSAVIDVTVH